MKAPSPRIYLLTGITLLTLLAATISLSYINLGPLNAVAALLIAAAKTGLIALFFMHLRYSRPIIWLCAGAGLFWLGILIVLALSDYLTRGWQ